MPENCHNFGYHYHWHNIFQFSSEVKKKRRREKSNHGFGNILTHETENDESIFRAEGRKVSLGTVVEEGVFK